MTSDDELLTASEAAQLLRCSRQHVVNLCDEGHLPYVRVGTHRRLRRRDVEAYRRPSLRREEEQSLWLHCAVAGKLVVDNQRVLVAAQANLASKRSNDFCSMTTPRAHTTL